VCEGSVNDVGLHYQVVVDELSWVSVVGVDTTHPGCRQINLIGFFFFKESLNGRLICQV
jgi:hypothetical protein